MIKYEIHRIRKQSLNQATKKSFFLYEIEINSDTGGRKERSESEVLESMQRNTIIIKTNSKINQIKE